MVVGAYEISTIEQGKTVSIKSVDYVIERVAGQLLYLKRKNGERIYRTAFHEKNGKVFALGLPRAA